MILGAAVVGSVVPLAKPCTSAAAAAKRGIHVADNNSSLEEVALVAGI